MSHDTYMTCITSCTSIPFQVHYLARAVAVRTLALAVASAAGEALATARCADWPAATEEAARLNAVADAACVGEVCFHAARAALPRVAGTARWARARHAVAAGALAGRTAAAGRRVVARARAWARAGSTARVAPAAELPAAPAAVDAREAVLPPCAPPVYSSALPIALDRAVRVTKAVCAARAREETVLLDAAVGRIARVARAAVRDALLLARTTSALV